MSLVFPLLANTNFDYKVALIDSYSELKYFELKHAIQCVANGIRLHIDDNVFWGVFLPNNNSAAISTLSVMSVGCCYCVLDPAFPIDRLKEICEIVNFSRVITDNEHYEEACKLVDPNRILIYEELSNANPLELNKFPNVDDNSPAVLFFTSGSTGKPKGVVYNHQKIALSLSHSNSEFELSDNECFDMIVSLSFMASIHLLFGLYKGVSIAFFDVKNEGILKYVEWLQKHKITFSIMSVSLFRGVCQVLKKLNLKGSQKYLSLVAEPVQPSDFVLFNEHFEPDGVLFQGYGSTETRTISLYKYAYGDPIPEVIPVGKPYGKCKIFILDQQLNEVAKGDSGQIAIASPYMADEYFRNEDETSKSFTLLPIAGDKIYLSGDLGRFDSDGMLYHEGRIDFMVKVRGNRVDIHEIERCLLGFDGISDVAVVNRGESFSTPVLVAYFEVNQEISIEDLHSYIETKLPEYMIPNFFEKLIHIPKTPTGKVSRKMLMDLPFDPNEMREENSSVDFVESDLYKQIKRIWMNELDVPRISPDNCFFNDLGGDSIIAASVLIEIEKAIGKSISHFTLFRYRTLRSFVRFIERDENKIVAIDPIRKGCRADAPVIIFVPPVKGGVETYNFAKNTFDPKFSLYVLTYSVVDNINENFIPLNEIIKAASLEIEKLDKSEVTLFGYSLGGLIAYDIACELESKTNTKLIIVDIPAARKRKRNLIGLITRDIRILRQSINQKNAKAIEFNKKYFWFLLSYFFINNMKIRARESSNLGVLNEAAHIRIYCQFDHKKYNSKMYLVRSTNGEFSKMSMRWNKFVKTPIEEIFIEGDHHAMLDNKNLERIASILT